MALTPPSQRNGCDSSVPGAMALVALMPPFWVALIPPSPRSVSHGSNSSIPGYQAPDKIDSKFFDPKYAFKDVEVPTKSVSELVSKKKPKV